MSNLEITALLPMRAGSKRVRGKNKRLLAGKPLYFHMLATLQQVDSVSKIVVSSDDMDLLEVLAREDKVQCLIREPYLAQDETSMNEVIADCLSKVSGENFIQVHATSPLIKADSIQDAIQDYFRLALPAGKSLMAVQEIEGRLWSPSMQPLNHDPNVLIPSQDMEKVLLDCSGFYVFSRSQFMARRSRIYGPPAVKAISEIEALDIDYEWQFELAELLLRGKSS